MSKAPWHLRNIRRLVYFGVGVALVGIAISAVLDSPDAAKAWIAARQLYGLWALVLLLASMLPGPLIFVFPWFPFKAHLILGRRAIGISSFVMAAAHVTCYLGPIASSGAWRNLYTPGNLWVCGLVIGLAALAALAVLALTSRRKSIRSLGPGNWKRLHKMVYLLLPAALLHASFVGTDFGINKGPDVAGEVDAGCLVAMVLISLAWVILFWLRKHHVRWAPSFLKRNQHREASRNPA